MKHEPTRQDYFNYWIQLEQLWNDAQSTWSIPDLKKIEELKNIIRFYYQFAPKKRED